MIPRIDAHQHYWEVSRGDYDWMSPDDPVLARRFMPVDLAPSLAKHGIARTVLVQAAATVEETEYLLGIADATETVAAVVGWVDFEKPEHLHHLRRLAQHPKFVGIRPMIQDIPDVHWMLRDDVQWGYAAVVDLDLTFDALGFPPHLDNFLILLRRYPEMRVVIDHCMKPRIRDHAKRPELLDRWAEGMTRLADETGACCKLSGLVTEAGEDWTPENLRPYADHVLAAFGAARVMWGSDWPVCRLRASYEAWRGVAEALTAQLGAAERDQVFGGTAARFYRLASDPCAGRGHHMPCRCPWRAAPEAPSRTMEETLRLDGERPRSPPTPRAGSRRMGSLRDPVRSVNSALLLRFRARLRYEVESTSYLSLALGFGGHAFV